MSYDVAVIGGGVIGSSVAYFVKHANPGATVVVVEPDPACEFVSTPRASGGCRVQFSCPENIAMSLYSLEFTRSFAATMATPEFAAEIGWVEGGYGPRGNGVVPFPARGPNVSAHYRATSAEVNRSFEPKNGERRLTHWLRTQSATMSTATLSLNQPP